MSISMFKVHPDGRKSFEIVRDFSRKCELLACGWQVEPPKQLPKPTTIPCTPMPRHEVQDAEWITDSTGIVQLQWRKSSGFKVELEDFTIWIADSEGLTEETYAKREEALNRYFELAACEGCHESSSIIA